MTDQISGQASSPNYIELAADIVSAYVTKNSVPAAELASLIASVHSALQGVGSPSSEPAPKFEPAVSIKKSVTPDAIISLIDGKLYKSLKRHLTGHGLTPDQYRERFGLPRDYPMVAASYAARRSELAKQAGLGQQRRKKTSKSTEGVEVTDKAPNKRGRKKSA
jgi:predicted transcriptional regulator